MDIEIGTTYRTECGQGRATYRPDWSVDQPFATYRQGVAGRHFATLDDVCNVPYSVTDVQRKKDL